MPSDWLLPPPIDVPAALREAVGGHPLVAELLTRRGLSDVKAAQAFLDPAYYQPSLPTDLPDLDLTAHRLLQAIEQGESILVWGDFDVDGQTSTALLVSALNGLGQQVRYHVPHRLKHGHGIQPDVLKEYIQRGCQVIVTCDVGITAHAAAQVAREAGVTLLITDHHALPPQLPDAPALVNPQRLPADHPLRDLPGVGVAYKLAEHLYRLAGRPDEAAQFLDLAALGIVSDVAIQQRDTRYLLQLGIDRLRYPQRVGIQALMRAAHIDPAHLSSDTIGFQIGPRLNALGRLDDARLAVELLTTEDEAVADQIAAQLEILNARRRQVEDQIYAAAQDQIASDPSLLNFEALVLAGEHWHPGIVGIVASRLVEQYQHPTVLLVTPARQSARGSARSVPGVNIGACIAAVGDLLIGHGGHPGAAGVSLDADLIPQFRRQLSNTIRQQRDPSIVPGRAIDAMVRLGEIGMPLAEEINRLSPFGAGNPPITLMVENVKLTHHASFGVNRRHRHLTVEDDHGIQHVITWWNGSNFPLPPTHLDMLISPRVSDYRGSPSLNLEWIDSRPIPGLEIDAGPRYTIHDLREGGEFPQECPAWVEAAGDSVAPPHQLNRAETRPTPELVVWTTPPGPLELIAMLEETGARELYVALRHKPDDTMQAFLTTLAGLVKYALRTYAGEAAILRLAAATAQRESTVRRGLEWLAARGEISLDWTEQESVKISTPGSPDNSTLEETQAALGALLAETRAYRGYLSQANLDETLNGR
jgi:single-stranded-DNA-specific exonuclease